MVKHTICLDFEEVTDVSPDVRITFYNAGHILGSAMVHLHIGNGLHNLLYTADLKYGRSHLLEPAMTIFPRLETMIIESTYGGKECVALPREEQEQMFINRIKETISKGGKVLIPVLGSGRAQEVSVILEDMMKHGMLDKFPIYVDGMIWDITAIHTAYPEFLNHFIRKRIFHKDDNPFLSDIFKDIGSQKERMQVVEEVGPCVILATSGMLQGGPSIEYLRHLADNPNNLLMFVSYQGEGSLGRKIQRGEKEVSVNFTGKNEIIPIKLSVVTIEGFSGHSSRKQLLNFIYKCDPKPKKVIVNHGESSRCLDLASSIHKMFKIETVSPRNLETMRLK